MPDPTPGTGWFVKLKRWGGLVSAIAGLLAAGGTVWKTIAYIDELHGTIRSNKAAVTRLVEANDEAHDELESRIGLVVTAIRTQHDRDQEVITQLRIAVGALQAAQGVRAGRMTYEGVQNDRVAFAATPRPPSARVRREQASQAENDAETALRRARRVQTTSEEANPLAALVGL